MINHYQQELATWNGYFQSFFDVFWYVFRSDEEQQLFEGIGSEAREFAEGKPWELEGNSKETPGNPWRNRRFFVGKHGQTMSNTPFWTERISWDVPIGWSNQMMGDIEASDI